MNAIGSQPPASQPLTPPPPKIRVDLQLVADMIPPGSRVLDVGCGDGTLLAYLGAYKQVDGRGLELSMARVRAAVSQGLSVMQGNLETDLKDYPEQAFDYVVLSQTLQATHHPKAVMEELLRIGRRAIVSLPNFGHWAIRLSLLTGGRMPVTKTLADSWYDTPNIHLCTIQDFLDLCKTMGVRIEAGSALDSKGRRQSFGATSLLANLFSEQAIFVLMRA